MVVGWWQCAEMADLLLSGQIPRMVVGWLLGISRMVTRMVNLDLGPKKKQKEATILVARMVGLVTRMDHPNHPAS